MDTPAEIARKAAIWVWEGTPQRKRTATMALRTGTRATIALERAAPSREIAWLNATNPTQPISTPCQSTCQRSSAGPTCHSGAGADQTCHGTTIRAEYRVTIAA